MSQITIELSPELEQELVERAEESGQKLEEYARAVLEQSLKPGEADARAAFERSLVRRTPEELERMIQEQGVKTVSRLEDLAWDFWPEDESADEFLDACRR